MHGKTGGQQQHWWRESDAGKSDVAVMACAAVHCSGENPAWLTYADSGNIAFCLKTDIETCCDL